MLLGAADTGWIAHYNTERLHAGLQYLTPEDYLSERHDERIRQRKDKLQTAHPVMACVGATPHMSLLPDSGRQPEDVEVPEPGVAGA